MTLLIPKRLKKGSLVATVSSSRGGAGLLSYRYNTGVQQSEEIFGRKIKEMEHTLKPADWVYSHPKERAEDFLNSFKDPSIEGIISTIGGDDSIRILPYIDFDVIKNNPKIFMGFSDSTISHFICYKAGIRSYYGPSIMAGLAENGGIFEYTQQSIDKTLFSAEPIGEIIPNTKGWTDEFLDRSNPENQKIRRKINPSSPRRFLQGDGIVEGELLGGCIDVFYFMRGTEIRPTKEEWKGKILFMETSEEEIDNQTFERILRTMGVQGILENLSGIIVGKAYKEKSYDESLLKIIHGEFGLTHLPIVTNMDFGHTYPVFILPIGAKMSIDFQEKRIYINEPGTI